MYSSLWFLRSVFELSNERVYLSAHETLLLPQHTTDNLPLSIRTISFTAHTQPTM